MVTKYLNFLNNYSTDLYRNVAGDIRDVSYCGDLSFDELEELEMDDETPGKRYSNNYQVLE